MDSSIFDCGKCSVEEEPASPECGACSELMCEDCLDESMACVPCG